MAKKKAKTHTRRARKVAPPSPPTPVPPPFDDPNLVVFEDPPPAPVNTNRVGAWWRVVEQLLARPGVWGRLGTREKYESARTAANHLREGRCRIPDGEFEFASRATELDHNGRPTPDSKGLIYGKYIGPGTTKSRKNRGGAGRPARMRARTGLTFYRWLAQYRNVRGDYRGEIARQAYADSGWPRSGPVNNFPYIQNYLRNKNLKGFELNQLDLAWKDYEVAREHLGK